MLDLSKIRREMAEAQAPEAIAKSYNWPTLSTISERPDFANSLGSMAFGLKEMPADPQFVKAKVYEFCGGGALQLGEKDEVTVSQIKYLLEHLCKSQPQTLRIGVPPEPTAKLASQSQDVSSPQAVESGMHTYSALAGAAIALAITVLVVAAWTLGRRSTRQSGSDNL